MSRIVNIHGAGGTSVDNRFILLVKTDNSGTSGTNQFTIPTTGGEYNYTVETTEQLLTGQTGSVTLTWAVAGTYLVYISDTFPRIYFNNGGDRLKLLEVQNWGNIAWTNFLSAFHGCANLQITATDVPNLSGVLNFQNIFHGCTALNSPSNIGSWNVSNITSMASSFLNATSFNQNISSWNVGNVTTMQNMLRNTAFNQNISSWNVSNVTNMANMFQLASAFNQDISSWNVSNVTNMSNMFVNATAFNQNIGSWNVGNVTNMSNMFQGATSFNQNISSWNVSNVTNMSNMFYLSSAFNQNLGGWSLRLAGISTLNQIFRNSGMSTENYTDTIVGWANYVFVNGGNPSGVSMTLHIGKTFNTSRSGGANFANAGDARTYLTTTAGWTISGDTII